MVIVFVWFGGKQDRMKATTGGQIYLGLIGLGLAAIGGLFVFLLGQGYLRAVETRGWNEVAAVVLVSDVRERQLSPEVPPEFTHEIVYEYRINGKFHRGERTKTRENPFYKNRDQVLAERDRWPVGKEVTARVNPSRPEQALLEHETKAPGYSIWFPALLLVGGLVIVARSLWRLLLFRKGEAS